MKKSSLLSKLLLAVTIGTITLTSCDEEPTVTFEKLTPAGEVDGTWSAGATVTITEDVVVPEGKSLIIEAGATITFAGDDLGTASAPELQVRGNLYIQGTMDNPVKFTVAEEDVTDKYAGYWGGIQCASSCEELLIDGAIIEYAGAPAGPNSIFVEQGEDEGDPRYSIFYGNLNGGKYVLVNSVIKNSQDDATRCIGGNLLMYNNVFAFVGETGGEAINLKSGVKADLAYNLFYACATNGTKWSNSGDNDPQTEVNSYNNTMVNCGWRRSKEGRGGSVNIEKGAKGNAYNNLVVNCRYGSRIVGGEDIADSINVQSDYNYYFGNEQEIVDEFYPSHGIFIKNINSTHDISANVNDNDPMFTNYDVATGKLIENVNFAVSDFYLQASSSALSGGMTSLTAKVGSLTLNGKTYTVPAISGKFGAFGSN